MVARICLYLIVIVSGLALRRFGLNIGLPAAIVKYGGSILWGTMVYFLVAITIPRIPRWSIAWFAAVIAIAVELFRLVHTPWLDTFRLTLAGALLFGRIFSWWNFLAYGAGMLLAFGLDALAVKPESRATPTTHSPN